MISLENTYLIFSLLMVYQETKYLMSDLMLSTIIYNVV